MEQAKESRPPSRSSSGSEDIILTKQVTLLDCTVLIAGTVIGSGIFISPKGILDNTGSVGWALIIWCACGIFSGVGALCYAELASSIPESGGDYSYLRHSFGPWVSFLRIWTGLLAVRTGGAVVVSLVAAKNIILAFGGNCAADSTSTALLAFVILGENSLCDYTSIMETEPYLPANTKFCSAHTVMTTVCNSGWVLSYRVVLRNNRFN